MRTVNVDLTLWVPEGMDAAHVEKLVRLALVRSEAHLVSLAVTDIEAQS
jgi:hypothetical protein